MSSPRSEFPPPFRLAEWTVQPDLNRIEGPGGPVQVEPRVMQVLLRLAEVPREVCSRQMLLDEVWGEAIVGEENLTRAISELRRIFGDPARQPRFIETIRHHGYRLLMAVEPIGPIEPGGEAGDEGEETPPVVDAESASEGVAESAPDANEEPARATAPPAAPRPVEPEPEPADAASSRSGVPVRGLALAAVLLLTLVAVFGPRLLRSPEPESPPATRALFAPATAVPLTSFPGREWQPALSPDGLRVAFIWAGEDGGNPDLYLKQRNSESLLRLSEAPGWAAWPAWSPDGQELAFVQQADERASLCVVPALGGVVRELLEIDSWVEGVDWSPDGRTLAFSARDGQDGRHCIHTLDLADLQVRTIPLERPDAAGDYLPRYRPDGQELAWIGVGLSGSNGIYRAVAGGGRAERLTEGMSDLQGLAWQSDGAGLIYAEAQAGRFQLWRLPLRRDGSPAEAEWIPTAGEFAWNPSIARQSGDLAYERVQVDQDVWRLKVLARDPWQVESAPFLRSTRWDSAADCDPTGRRIVFVSTRSGSPQIWLCDRDGGDLQRLTSLTYPSVANPRFSPDGHQVAASVLRGGKSAVVIVAARGGEPRTLTPEGRSEIFSSWSPDGRLVIGADTDTGWQLFALDPQGEQRQPLTRSGGVTGRLTADGALICTRPGAPGLWRIAPGAQQPELIADGLDSRDRYNWLIVGTDLARVMRLGGRAFLAIQDLDGGAPSILAELPDLADAGLGAQPDGSAFYWTRTQASAGDLMLLPAASRAH